MKQHVHVVRLLHPCLMLNAVFCVSRDYVGPIVAWNLASATSSVKRFCPRVHCTNISRPNKRIFKVCNSSDGRTFTHCFRLSLPRLLPCRCGVVCFVVFPRFSFVRPTTTGSNSSGCSSARLKDRAILSAKPRRILPPPDNIIAAR